LNLSLAVIFPCVYHLVWLTAIFILLNICVPTICAPTTMPMVAWGARCKREQDWYSTLMLLPEAISSKSSASAVRMTPTRQRENAEIIWEKCACSVKHNLFFLFTDLLSNLPLSQDSRQSMKGALRSHQYHLSCRTCTHWDILWNKQYLKHKRNVRQVDNL
jgi:hypothetical protein